MNNVMRMSFKERIQKLGMQALRTIEHVFFVFPIQRNRIMFQSFGHADGYCCSPKYVCEYLKAHFSGRFELVWTFRDPKAVGPIDGIRAVRLNTLKWLYLRLTSKVVVLNEGPSAYVAKRKGQYVIQTWHGCCVFKKAGLARDGITPLWSWVYERTGRDIDLFTANGEVPARFNTWDVYHYTGEVLNSGVPRNDLLLNVSACQDAARKARTALGIDEAAFTVLYAPTFRNTDENPDGVFSFAALQDALEQRFHRKVVFLQRLHRYNRGAIAADAPTIDVTNYPDMQELLCAADLLITDYSSCMWDYALLERPCLLYVPDLKEYDSARGFFTPIAEWPGIICESADALYQTASSLDPALSAEKARAHLKRNGSYETGHACEQVAERILAVTGQKGAQA